MSFASRLVEERIRRAQQEGAFENLPGSGKPLRLEAEQDVPAELRLAYKILKNARCLPPEVELRREILSLQSLLDCLEDTEDCAKRIRQINFRILKLNCMKKVPLPLEVRQMIAEKIAVRKQPTVKLKFGSRQAAETVNTLSATDAKG